MKTKKANSDQQFIDALDARIDYHRSNTYDPYNIGNAAILILTEVREAFRESRKPAPPSGKKGRKRK